MELMALVKPEIPPIVFAKMLLKNIFIKINIILFK